MKKTIFMLVLLLSGWYVQAQQDTIYLAKSLCVDSVWTSGLYTTINSRISQENFPVSSTDTSGYVIMKVFHFDRNMSKEKIIKHMEKAGYRPANLIELHRYRCFKKNKKISCPLVGLGSSYIGLWRTWDFPTIENSIDSLGTYEFVFTAAPLYGRYKFPKACYFLGVQE